MKPVTMYECEHCKKIFKTKNRHACRHNPALKSCYSCKHWKHQFVLELRGEDVSCYPHQACDAHTNSYVEEAFGIMRHSGWQLNCPSWELSIA